MTPADGRWRHNELCPRCRAELEAEQWRLDDELMLQVRAMNAVDRAVASYRRATGDEHAPLGWAELLQLLREPS